jgi:hypothetical protein
VYVPVAVNPVNVFSPGGIDSASLTQVVPSEVSTLPDVPGLTTCTVDVPLPVKTPLAVKVSAPVPPEFTGRGAPSGNCIPVVPLRTNAI